MTSVKMTWPASCKVITQQYGNKSSRYVSGAHTGLDIGCTQGSPIYAATDGMITFAGWNGVYGNEVRVKYNDALETSYHHMSRIAAVKGKTVSAGTVIGYIGSTGQSTGPHLHFEVRVNGKHTDPIPYLSGGATVPGAVNASSDNPLVPDTVEGPLDFLGGIATWMSEPKNWFRVGLVLGGALLILFATIGMAKTQALGKNAGKAVANVAKKMKGGKTGGEG